MLAVSLAFGFAFVSERLVARWLVVLEHHVPSSQSLLLLLGQVDQRLQIDAALDATSVQPLSLARHASGPRPNRAQISAQIGP